MSNGYKDYSLDCARAPEFSEDWNHWFAWRYPWMAINKNGGTHAEDFPSGWWAKFGLEMIEEIDLAYRETYRSDFMTEIVPEVLQIKEKYGTLRFYISPCPEKVSDVISKYEKLSSEICIKCGAPATKVTNDWIMYWCDHCAPEDSVETTRERKRKVI